MSTSKKNLEISEVQEEEETYPLNYIVNIYDGGHFTINIGEHCEVRVMSGQPSNPNPRPPGT